MILSFLKKLLKILIILFLLLILFLIYSYFLPIGQKISKGINQENIQTIKLGMSENEVKQILGKPLSIENYKKEYITEGNITYPEYTSLIYSETGIFGVEIYVFIENKKVSLVNLESFDLGIYECSNRYCKILDRDRFNTLIPKKDGSIPLNIKLMLLFEFILGLLLLKWMRFF